MDAARGGTCGICVWEWQAIWRALCESSLGRAQHSRKEPLRSACAGHSAEKERAHVGKFLYYGFFRNEKVRQGKWA